MIAEEAAKLIAPYVGLRVETDSDELFQILTLVQSKAWKMGVYKGMVRDFNVNTRTRIVNGKERKYIITPHGFEIMLGVNLDGKPAPIHDNYFQFNNNGNGSMTDCCGCNWSEGVIDLGEFPTLFQPCENTCCCGERDCNSASIGVVSYNCFEDQCHQSQEHVLVKGLNYLDNPVFTYEDSDPYDPSNDRCRSIDPRKVTRKAIEGDRFPIKRKLVVHKNIKWSRIDSISKGHTVYPVEVFRVCGNDTDLLARIEPYQKQSRYRIYELPDCCGSPSCVHGLFKIGKPDPIVHGSQAMIVDDSEALIALGKSFDLTYTKQNVELGEAFLAKGIKSLDDEVKMNRSNSRVPMVVLENEHYDEGFDFT